MKKIYFLLLLNSVVSIAQTQIGSAIYGRLRNDRSGWSISLSSDGNIVAIGAPAHTPDYSAGVWNAGQVRIFKNVSGVWTQIGSDILGVRKAQGFGVSVSLSSDGNVVAVGELNYGSITPDCVRVYQNLSGVWTQIGSAIEGEGGNGRSVSLSSDGSVLAIGSPYSHVSGTESGHVRIFKNVSGVWTQIGSNINGEATGDNSGSCVSLSSDGNTVAIGSPYGYYSETQSGQVRIFKNVSGVWTKIGSNINGTANIKFGSSVSLSSNGNIVAVGAPFSNENGYHTGHVRVYENLSGVWTEIGSAIIGAEAVSESGWSVSLSSDGSIVAFGAPNAILGDGHVRIFKNVEGVWTPMGSIIGRDGNFGSSVSLSSSGRIVAMGGYSNRDDAGDVRVFDITAVLASDSFVQSNFLIYPNPSNGIINISLENNLQLEKVSVYNQLGQLVKITKTNVINTMELAKGTYYVEVVTDQGKATKQIIVE